MASPFDGLFGSNAGLDLSGAAIPSINSGMAGAPEVLPWGVTAYPQDQPLTNIPQTQGGGGFNLASLFGMGPSAQTPQQGPTPGLVPPDPNQQPGQPIYTQDRGIFGNLSRSLYGPSQAERLQAQQFQETERAKLKQSAATTQVLQRLNELRAQNPNMPQNMLQQQLFNDPVFLQNAMKNSPSDMVDFVNKVNESIFGKTQIIHAPADSSLLTYNPTAGTAPGQPGAPTEVYRAPKSFNANTVAKRAETVTSDDPRVKQWGLNGLKPNQPYEVKLARDAEGHEYVADINYIGPSVDMASNLEQDELKNRINRAGKLKEQQQSVVSAARTAQRIDDLLKEAPDKQGTGAIGPYGLATRIGQAALEQGKQIAKDAALPFDPTAYTEGFAAFKNLDRRAANAQAVQSNILALAFQIARVNNNSSGNVTQKDVNSALSEIGANFGSTVQLRAGLREMIGRGIHNLDDAIEIERPSFTSQSGKLSVNPPDRTVDVLGRLGLTRFLTGDQAKPTGTSTEQTTAPAKGSEIPVGTRRQFGGAWYRFKGGTNTRDNWERE